MKTYITPFLLALSLATTSIAQTAKLNKANELYQQLDYQGAIELYEQILKKGVKPVALFNLADCYRRVGNSIKAEQWYSQAITHPEAAPEMYVYYGQMLLANGRHRDAQRQFEKFLSLKPADVRAQNNLKGCNDTLRQELLNLGGLYQVRNLEEINTPNDDFGAAFYRKGIVFSTERDTFGSVFRRSAWTGRPFVDLYYTIVRLVDEDKMEFKISKASEFSRDLNSKFHDGPVCFSPDQSQIFVTRNHLTKNKLDYSSKRIIHTKIIQAKGASDSWSNIENTAFSNPEYSTMHPSITPDGSKMYFSSDMEGGFGGMDLYVAYNEAGNWSAPINLGPDINTEGDEVFPYAGADGKLYFSSDGHAGLGGLDVYYSKATRGKWDAITNVGNPINSTKDDFNYCIDSTRRFGFFSSNRDGGKGLTDIYMFTRLSVEAEILVFDKNTGKGLEGVTLTADCLPRSSFKTDIEGKAYIEMPINKNCKFSVTSPEHGTKEVEISTNGFAIGSKLNNQIPIETEKNLVFAVTGTVNNQENEKPIAGAILSLISSCGATPQSGISLMDGTFAFNLQPNCCYVVQASKEGFFTSTANFCTKGLFKSDTLAAAIIMPPVLSLSVDGLDTTSLFVVEKIYHEYNSATIKEESSTDLEKLVTLLTNNPDVAIEIRSHTDTRGSDAFNFNLSNARAKAVADYLIKHGIAENRVGYKGMGKSQPINGCNDDFPCTEEQHQLNRRTEFRVIRMKSN